MADKAASRVPVPGIDRIKVVLLYGAFASLWVLISDSAVEWLFDAPQHIILAGILKGLLFVAVTCLLLYRATQGDVRDIFGTSRDITELKRAEKKIRDNEQKYRTLFETANDGIFLCSKTGFVDCNQRGADMYGLVKGDIIGRSPLDLSPEVQPNGQLSSEAAAGKIQAALDGNPQSFEWQSLRSDGVCFDSEVKLNRVEVGGSVLLRAFVQDITERKNAEKALLDSALRLRTILQTANEGFWLIDNDTITTDLNPRMCAILGRNREDILGKKIFEFVDNKNKVIFEHQIRLRAQGQQGSYEIALSCPDGSQVCCQFNVTPLWDVSGTKIGAFAMVTDITERKRDEEARRLNESRLEALIQLNQMTDATLQEIASFAMEEAVRLTQSTMGYVALMNEDETVLSMQAWSRTAMQECRIDDKPLEYPVETTGLWGEAVRQRRPIITNDYQAPNPLKRGTPQGHVAILRHLNVPIFDGGRIVIVAGVGNKATDYDESDVRQLTLLMTGMWRIVQRKRSDEALRESEERYRQIARCVPDMIWTMDLSGRLTYANSVVERTYGFTVEEALKLTFRDFSTPEAAAKYEAIIEKELKRATAPGYDRNRIRAFLSEEVRKDGSNFWAEVSAAFLWSDDGKPFGIIGTTRDITGRKQAEDELMRLAAAIEQASEGICICDTNWLICYINSSFGHMSGYDRTDLIGQHLRILQSGNHDTTFYGNIREPLSRGEAWAGRLTTIKKDGTSYKVECTASPIRNVSGEIINYVAIHRDITHQVKLEAELHQARKMEAIGLLAGGIAHDFNNILAAIMGFTELSLFKMSEDNPVRSNLEHVLKAASRASEVVKQILTFTRKGVQERSPVRIGSIVLEALKLMRSSLPSTIEIRQEIAIMPGQDHLVLADPGQIHQVLMNLGTNAGHAMKTKGGTLTVRLSVTSDASQLSVHPGLKVVPHVCIAVSDTGHGMDSEVLERIFDPYFTTKGPGEGTGLGLSVVQGIVKSHNGAITARSKPRQGTTFSVFLPVLESVDAEDAKTLQPPPTGTERILLVDDEEVLIDLGKEILEILGYQITATTSSLDALEVFREQPYAFDLVITDMTMPSLTGRELAKKIIALRSDTPIILSTGYSDLIDEKQAKEAGIREFVLKPYEIRTFAGVIRKALE
jgi:PAS domain S-box-containing protein